MKRRGIALIFSLLVILVLSILLSCFFLKSINENNLVRRYINSMRAFWTAEAGLAEAIKNLPSSPNNGSLGEYSYQATTTYRTTINFCNYYDISSTSTVGGTTRTIHAVVKTGTVDPTKFQYGLQAANDLCFGGNCNKPAEDYLDPDVCGTPPNTHPCWKEFDATINFRDMFGYELSTVQGLATHYTSATFPGTVSGVSWVDVDPGSTLMVTSNLEGSGLLIINGNVHFGGTYQFHGIVYVLGTMTARGTFDAYGSIVVASTSDVDSINGTPEFHWSEADIISGLQQLALSTKVVVSWWES
ncbi:MAG: hypothetical protein Q8N49_00055 [Candidatus Omnitrophota bacterium]|nr:hypothetical protein [Candidatus Omnitrophota bacterium]